MTVFTLVEYKREMNLVPTTGRMEGIIKGKTNLIIKFHDSTCHSDMLEAVY